jgi:hypothetical protein
MARFSNFVFTIFQDKVCSEWEPCSSEVKYCVWQWEKCPKSGKVHAQGYIELKKQQRIRHIKKFVLKCDSAHIERRYGTPNEAREYCLKDESRFAPGQEYGTISKGQGERTDIEVFIKEIGTCSDLDMLEKFPGQMARYYKFYEKVKEWRARHESMRFRVMEVMVFFGSAGSGKTRAVYDKHAYEDVYSVTINGREKVWFTGYNGQDVVLLDDYYGNFPLGFFLRFLDGYPLQLDCKGSHTYANFTKVYITSNVSPEIWYKNLFVKHDELKKALFRRFTLVKKF